MRRPPKPNIWTRLSQLEKKSSDGGGPYHTFNSLSYEQVDALCELFEAAIDVGEEPTTELAIRFLTDVLECEEKQARYVWVASKNLPRDPNIGSLSENELDGLLESLRDQCLELEAQI